MQKYFNNVTNVRGDVVAGATVTVTGGTIYATNDTTQPIVGGVLTTDANGYFQFYAPYSRLTLTVNYTGLTAPQVFSDVLIEDQQDGSMGTFAALFGTALTINATPGGATALLVPANAAAVNGWQLSGSVAGTGLDMRAIGSDTNISIGYNTKGAGSHYFNANGSIQLVVGGPANSVNYVQLTGTTVGGAPAIGAVGSDTNIGVNYNTKAGGWHAFSTNNALQFSVSGGINSVNALQAQGGAAGNAAALSAVGADTSISVQYNSKGTGIHAFNNPIQITDPSAGTTNSLRVIATNTPNGAGIYLTGNGATTPSKTLRVNNGMFQIINSAYSAAIFTLDDAGTITAVGNVIASSLGTGFRTKEGANGKQGVATLVAGQVVVANTSITATSRIFLTSQQDGGTPGWLRVSARTAGTSFTIQSSSGSDTSVVAYEIFEQG